MGKVDDIVKKARSVDAIIQCDSCDFREAFDEFLDRDGRVDEENEQIIIGCPSCGHETMNLGKEVSPGNIHVVATIEELEDLAGE